MQKRDAIYRRANDNLRLFRDKVDYRNLQMWEETQVAKPNWIIRYLLRFCEERVSPHSAGTIYEMPGFFKYKVLFGKKYITEKVRF